MLEAECARKRLQEVCRMGRGLQETQGLAGNTVQGRRTCSSELLSAHGSTNYWIVPGQVHEVCHVVLDRGLVVA
jgi:hypothetical protein